VCSGGSTTFPPPPSLSRLCSRPRHSNRGYPRPELHEGVRLLSRATAGIGLPGLHNTFLGFPDWAFLTRRPDQRAAYFRIPVPSKYWAQLKYYKWEILMLRIGLKSLFNFQFHGYELDDCRSNTQSPIPYMNGNGSISALHSPNGNPVSRIPRANGASVSPRSRMSTPTRKFFSNGCLGTSFAPKMPKMDGVGLDPDINSF